jgi:hypothetical protein
MDTKKLKKHHLDKASVLTEISRQFALILDDPDINEEQIDAAIEELRPIRMWFHASKYGEAPGYRQGVGNFPAFEA